MASNILEAMGIKSASRLQFKNKRTGAYDLWLPWANNIELSLKSDEVVANQQGEKAIVWSSAKEGEFKVSTEITNFSMLSLMLGSNGIETKDVDVFKREVKVLTASDISAGQITLAVAPKAGTLGVASLYEDKASYKETFIVDTEGTTPPTGHVLLSSQIVKFASGDFVAGDIVAFMYFKTNTGGKSFTVASTGTTDSYEVYGDTIAKMLSDKAEKFYQLQVFDATVKQGATISFDASKASSFELTMTVVGDTTRPDTDGNPSMFSLVPIE